MDEPEVLEVKIGGKVRVLKLTKDQIRELNLSAKNLRKALLATLAALKIKKRNKKKK